MSNTPIVKLSRSSSIQQDASIRAVVSLLWPYSSLSKQCAFLLADPDFRMRNNRGQVRVVFTGPAAEAVARVRVGIGDSVTLHLAGARWSEEKDLANSPGSKVDTPGKSVDGQLLFESRLRMSVVQDGVTKEVQVDYEGYTKPVDAPTLGPIRSKAMAPSSLVRTGDVVPVYSSPAFAKRMRLSMEHYVDFAQDSLDGPTQADHEAHGTPFSAVKQWRLTNRTPSPVKSDAIPRTSEHNLASLSAPEVQAQDSPSPLRQGDAPDQSILIPSPTRQSPSRTFGLGATPPVAKIVSLVSPEAESPRRSQSPTVLDDSHVSVDKDSPLECHDSLEDNLTDAEVTELFPVSTATEAQGVAGLPPLDQQKSPAMSRLRRSTPPEDFDEMYDLSDREDGAVRSPVAEKPARSRSVSSFVSWAGEETLPQSQDAIAVVAKDSNPVLGTGQNNAADACLGAELEIISALSQTQNTPTKVAELPEVTDSFDTSTENSTIMAQTFQSLFGFGTSVSEPVQSHSTTPSRHSDDGRFAAGINLPLPSDEASQIDATVESRPPPLDRSSNAFPEAVDQIMTIEGVDESSQEARNAVPPTVDAAEAPQRADQPVLSQEITDIAKPSEILKTTSGSGSFATPTSPLPDSAQETSVRGSGHAEAADIILAQGVLSKVEQDAIRMEEENEAELADHGALESQLVNDENLNGTIQRKREVPPDKEVSAPMQLPASEARLDEPPSSTHPTISTPQDQEAQPSPEKNKNMAPTTTPDSSSRRRVSSRLSAMPATLSTWFSPKPEKQEKGTAPPTLKKATSSGLRTSFGYFSPLSELERSVNSRQGSGKGGVDVMAVVTSGTKPPARSKAGPRDHYTTFEITDATLSGANIKVEVFRPWKAKLPVAEAGDVVLLRLFAVKSRKRQPYLLSGDESAYCVWRFADAQRSEGNAGKPVWAHTSSEGHDGTVREEMKGPVVEFGDEERQQVNVLRSWWDKEHVYSNRAVADTNGSAAQELTAES